MDWPRLVPELTVLDFKRSLSFYVETVGFAVENIRKNPNFAYLKLGQAHLMIQDFHVKGWNVGSTEYPMGGGINFQIECDDVLSLRERLMESGVTLYRELNDTWYTTGKELSGFKELLVQDPSGYLLRFSQYLGEKPINA